MHFYCSKSSTFFRMKKKILQNREHTKTFQFFFYYSSPGHLTGLAKAVDSADLECPLFVFANLTCLLGL